MLQTAGFVRRSEDVLIRRKPVYTVADPIIRFGMLVVRPRQAQYEERRPAEAWAESQEVVRSRILGPHFEELARDWTLRHASPDTTGGAVSVVGSAVVNDPAGRARHEIDVVALAQGETLHRAGARIRAIGEAKSTNRLVGDGELARLDGIAALLGARGHDITGMRRMLYSRSGFTPELHRTATARADVELVDLERLYTGR